MQFCNSGADCVKSPINTKLSNEEININRTDKAWLSVAYTDVTICTYKILSDGIYLFTGYVTIESSKADRTYFSSINVNGIAMVKATQMGSAAYGIQIPMSTIIACKAGDIITTTAQVNYVNESYAGLATGILRLIKLY